MSNEDIEEHVVSFGEGEGFETLVKVIPMVDLCPLDDAVRCLVQESVLGLAIHWTHETTGLYHEISTVQLSCGSHTFIFVPSPDKQLPMALFLLLTHPSYTKVICGDQREVIGRLWNDFGVKVDPVLDLQAFIEREFNTKSLPSALNRVFPDSSFMTNPKVLKAEWSIPLSQEQLEHASFQPWAARALCVDMIDNGVAPHVLVENYGVDTEEITSNWHWVYKEDPPRLEFECANCNRRFATFNDLKQHRYARVNGNCYVHSPEKALSSPKKLSTSTSPSKVNTSPQRTAERQSPERVREREREGAERSRPGPSRSTGSSDGTRRATPHGSPSRDPHSDMGVRSPASPVSPTTFPQHGSVGQPYPQQAPRASSPVAYPRHDNPQINILSTPTHREHSHAMDRSVGASYLTPHPRPKSVSPAKSTSVKVTSTYTKSPQKGSPGQTSPYRSVYSNHAQSHRLKPDEDPYSNDYINNGPNGHMPPDLINEAMKFESSLDMSVSGGKINVPLDARDRWHDPPSRMPVDLMIAPDADSVGFIP